MPGAGSPHKTTPGESENVVHDYPLQMFDALKARAENGTYTGSVTEVYKTLGISNQYYTQILRALVESGSVEHVQRGHHKRPSIYKLIKKPTKKQLATLDFLTPKTRRATVGDSEILNRLNELERRVGKVDVIAALTNLEKRITALEKR